MNLAQHPDRASLSAHASRLEPARGGVAHGRRAPAHPTRRPLDRVGKNAPNLLLVIDRIRLVPGTEVEDSSRSAMEAATAPEDFTAGEGADKDQLVRLGNVEKLAVHLLLGHDEHLRYACRNRMSGIDRPDELALSGL